MKTGDKYLVVLVTAPDMKVARKVARAALQAQLVACANLVSHVESHYWWQGKLEKGGEVLMILKTRRPRLSALEKCILANHPYDCPEILALPVEAGHRAYLDWISEEVI